VLGRIRSSTTLNVYSHFLPEADRSAAEMLGRIFDVHSAPEAAGDEAAAGPAGNASVLHLPAMAMVHLPDELAQRLEAEAARRGSSVEALAVEAIQGRHGTNRNLDSDALEAFIGLLP